MTSAVTIAPPCKKGSGWRKRSWTSTLTRRDRAVAKGVYKEKRANVQVPAVFASDVKAMAIGKIIHVHRQAAAGVESHSLKSASNAAVTGSCISRECRKQDDKTNKLANSAKHQSSNKQISWAKRHADAWADQLDEDEEDIADIGEKSQPIVDIDGPRVESSMNPEAPVFYQQSPSSAHFLQPADCSDKISTGTFCANSTPIPSIGAQLDYMIQFLCSQVSTNDETKRIHDLELRLEALERNTSNGQHVKSMEHDHAKELDLRLETLESNLAKLQNMQKEFGSCHFENLADLENRMTKKVEDARDFNALGDLLSQGTALEKRVQSLEHVRDSSSNYRCGIKDIETRLDALLAHTEKIFSDEGTPDGQTTYFEGEGAVPGALEKLVRRVCSVEQHSRSHERVGMIHSRGLGDAVYRIEKLEGAPVGQPLPNTVDKQLEAIHDRLNVFKDVHTRIELAIAMCSPENLTNLIEKCIEASIPGISQTVYHSLQPVICNIIKDLVPSTTTSPK